MFISLCYQCFHLIMLCLFLFNTISMIMDYYSTGNGPNGNNNNKNPFGMALVFLLLLTLILLAKSCVE